MPLETYRRKRDFAKTPEPSGDSSAGTAPPTGSRRFVVQRHRATRLHYDFRLEIDGVLMSWAVPRGPSLRPLERRLAARTEDHPLEYFDFEGVIPSGEYGGGDVIVWDWGTWEPEETDDPGEAVRKGELKFVLHGEKLKGRFVLVRTRRDGDKEDWLLMHKRDEDADPDWDIDALPKSVKSGRTNDEVKAGAPAVWDSRAPAAEAAIDLAGAKKAPLPDFVPPMLATAVDKPFSDDDWLYEMKLDGYRVEAVVKGRAGPPLDAQQAGRGALLPRSRGGQADLDQRHDRDRGRRGGGARREGRPDFSLLQDRTGMRGFASKRGERRPRDHAEKDEAEEERPKARLAYFLFDLLYLDGQSLVDVPLEERKKLLKISLREHAVVQYATHIERDGEDFYEAARKQGLEGIVAKLRRSRYEPGGGRRAGSRSRSGATRSSSWSATSRARAATPTWARCSSRSTRETSCGTPARSAAASTSACAARCASSWTRWRGPIRRAPGRRPSAAPTGRSRRSSSAPSSASGPATTCCARRPSRASRSAATRSRCAVSGRRAVAAPNDMPYRASERPPSRREGGDGAR